MVRMTRRSGLGHVVAAVLALLYGAALVGANPALAGDLGPAERAELESLRDGDMVKLVFHDTPEAPLQAPFADEAGVPVSLADYRGKVVFLNFWATWCPPCRAEMPSIDRLSAALPDQDFAVLALSVDRGAVDKIARFYDMAGIEHLAVLQDAKSVVAREARALGLPVTLIIDREGREVARLQGAAEWDSPSAQAILRRLAALTAGES